MIPTTATGIAAAIRARKTTARQVMDATLAKIAAENPGLGSFTEVLANPACQKADAIDVAIAAGGTPGPLVGVPFAVKNLLDIRGLTTLAGSKINRGLPVADRDAVLIKRLEAAGAILVGALNMGEYAYDFTGENHHDGPSRNPHDRTRMSGGSSGGSGTAVGAGLVPLALGSDTNGSIRVPSSFCGIYGLKPTYGRLPRSGSFPFVDSLDHLGPMARNVTDLALAYDAMQGFDSGDPACANRPIQLVSDLIRQGTEGLRIAMLDGWFRLGACAQALAAVESCARALGTTRTATLEGAEQARNAAFIITTVEAAALHSAAMRTRIDDFGPAIRDRLISGALVPGAIYVNAQRLRRAFQVEMAACLVENDILLAPATPMTAPMLGAKTMEVEGKTLPLKANIGRFTQPISFIGLPVVAVPTLGDTMPIGVQVIAGPGREDLALRVAQALSDAGVAAVQKDV
jgi:AtzE family amidohydrolase